MTAQFLGVAAGFGAGVVAGVFAASYAIIGLMRQNAELRGQLAEQRRAAEAIARAASK